MDNEYDLDIVNRKVSPVKQKIEESRISLRNKIRAGVGISILTSHQYVTYVAPVKYCEGRIMEETFGREKGEARWIKAQDFC